MKIFLNLVLLVALIAGYVPVAEAFKDLNVEQIEEKARDGDPVAQTKMGVIYARGLMDKVEIDKKKAVEWYRKAADQGYPNGQWNLAFMYVRGEGVNEDFDKARELFLQAAEQGYAPAEYDLGMMYLYGMGGKRSRSEALTWIRKAAAQDYREAIGFLRSQGELGKEQQQKMADDMEKKSQGN